MTLDELNKCKDDHPALLVDFYADWCEPCKMLDGILVDVAQNLTGKIHILKVDIDSSAELKNEFDIKSIPTLMLFKNGELTWRMAGFLMANDLTRKIEEFL